MSSATLEDLRREAQWVAWTPSPHKLARHRLLRVVDAGETRRFVAAMMDAGWVGFDAAANPSAPSGCRVNLGFTAAGLQALGADDALQHALRAHARAFTEGARARAAHVGDTGPSDPSRWEPAFDSAKAQLVLTLHADAAQALDDAEARLAALPGAQGLDGWQDAAARQDAAHIADPRAPEIHFGFRDGITNPEIVDGAPDPQGARHRAGELLLGLENDVGFDPWPWARLPESSAAFLRHGSFAVLRKIRQHEVRFEHYVRERCAALADAHPGITPDYLKAKLCGRWPNGMLVRPQHGFQMPAAGTPETRFRFAADDPQGLGCPFGSHIRRTNPRDDPLAPARLRPLFRRSLPYGPRRGKDEHDEQAEPDRGLMGLFFCASIEDQFETLMSEWVEKMPMGPPSRGDAKDPLIGNADDPAASFHIPQASGPGIHLRPLGHFTTTRGALYLFYPARRALERIALWSGGAMSADPAGPDAPAAPAATPSANPRPPRAAAARGPARAAVPPAPPPDAGADASRADEDVAPATRFCDIVMEGGVTSGFVYTRAVHDLSRHFRFHGIAGSSIGAFAAALTAAAEFGRRGGSVAGFQAIDGMAEALSQEVDGRTRLLRLFRPQHGTRRLFAIFVAALGRRSRTAAAVAALRAALRQYAVPAGVAALLVLLLVLSGPAVQLWRAGSGPDDSAVAVAAALALALSWLSAAVLSAAAAAAVALGVGLVCDLRRWVGNGFGLCRGWGDAQEADGEADLAGFLHASIQHAAGRHPVDNPPLSFRDLHQAPGGPGAAAGALGGPAAERGIDLQIYVANLTHGRPYRFPLADDDGGGSEIAPLYFRPVELAPYFPRAVLDHLMATSTALAPGAGEAAQGWRRLPGADLPVVVAVRMAMSFPGLLSAVPLGTCNHGRAGAPVSRCWMSDGGLCSNFPIHLFDSFIPEWPTFGISLHEDAHREGEHRVWLPATAGEGAADRHDAGMDDTQPPLDRLAGFLMAAWRTAWGWQDSTMMRMPGVRDRVVRVYLRPGEGGINIRMTGEQIRHLADDYGRRVAAAFVAKFVDGGAIGWHEHRWLRYCTLLTALGERVAGLRAAAAASRHNLALADQIASALQRAPLRRPDGAAAPPLAFAEVQQLQALLRALLALERAFPADGRPYRPEEVRPAPGLRVRHPV